MFESGFFVKETMHKSVDIQACAEIKKINFFVDILEYDLKKNHITPYYLSLTVIYNLRILSA